MWMSKALFSPSKSFIFKLAQPKDKEPIVKFLTTYFRKEEPCSRALNLSPDVATNIFSPTVDRCLQFPFSTIVTDGQGTVAACLLSSVWKRSDPLESADFAMENTPENVQLFVKFINNAHANFWKVAPQHVDAVIHRELGSVAKPYTRNGIARRMVTENMSKKQLRQFNIGGVISETSSLYNQLLLEKSGFRCLKEMPYSDIVDSKGRQVLRLDDGTSSLKLNFKAIEDYEYLPE